MNPYLAFFFQVVMYGCESWTIKKAECLRTNASELWCWRRLLRVPWIARISASPSKRKSFLNIHWKDWCWNWNSNTLATWWKNWLIGKDPDAGRDWGQEEKGTTGWDGWMASLTRWTWVWVKSGSWWWTGRPGMLQSRSSQSWARLSDWTELTEKLITPTNRRC